MSCPDLAEAEVEHAEHSPESNFKGLALIMVMS